MKIRTPKKKRLPDNCSHSGNKKRKNIFERLADFNKQNVLRYEAVGVKL